MPLPEEAAKSAKATHDLLRRFKELGANMKSHPPPSAIEQDLQGERTVVDTFLEQLTVASRAAETLVTALEDTQIVTADFGTSLLKVCQIVFTSCIGLTCGALSCQRDS